jgi:glutamyl-tRNA synthetase
MITEVRTRFAPSPTGYMHIGNLRTALYTYLIAKSNNGKFILRIEDTDQERFIEETVDVIYNTLKSVGLEYDEGPDIGGEYGPYIQSQRRDLYWKYIQKLIDLGGAYYCFCSRERLDNLRKENEKKKLPIKYDGHCRNLTRIQAEDRIKSGETFVIRQKMPQEGTTSFMDEVFGKITVNNNELDDGILYKSDGMPTYNFANVVDDHLMKISHVIRGSEYLSSTPKYNLLYNMFGWEIPTYIHLPPVGKEGGKKLSKRDGDASFQDLCSRGFLKEAIINYISLLGWSPGNDQEIFTLKELEQIFSVDGLNKAPAIFDIMKLKWMNGEYIRKMSLNDFNVNAEPYYKRIITKPDIDFLRLSKLLHTRIEVLSEIPNAVDFIETLPDYDVELYIHKRMKADLNSSLKILENVYEELSELDEWEEEKIHDLLSMLVKDMGVKNGQVFWPVRIAVSGKKSTPGGAIEILDLLGKKESLNRIKLGIEKLKTRLII